MFLSNAPDRAPSNVVNENKYIDEYKVNSETNKNNNDRNKAENGGMHKKKIAK